MAIALSDIRTAIQDVPKVNPPNSSPPEVLGIGDGATTSFFFRVNNVIVSANYPLFVALASINSGPSFKQVQQTDPNTPWAPVSPPYGPPVIVFGAPPAAGQIIGARYYWSMFSDAELTSYLARANIYASDRLTLKGITADLIDAILMNDDKFRIRTLGDTKSDPSQIRAALSDQRAKIMAELSDTASTSTPYMGVSGYNRRPYIN